MHSFQNCHPAEMSAAGRRGAKRSPTPLAVDGNVTAVTQHEVLSALLFLFREVVSVAFPGFDGVVSAEPSAPLLVGPCHFAGRRVYANVWREALARPVAFGTARV